MFNEHENQMCEVGGQRSNYEKFWFYSTMSQKFRALKNYALKSVAPILQLCVLQCIYWTIFLLTEFIPITICGSKFSMPVSAVERYFTSYNRFLMFRFS